MKVVYDLMCRCGRRTRVTSLLREVECAKCGWPIVYATGRHAREMSPSVPLYVRSLPPDARRRRRTAVRPATKGREP